MWSHVDGLIENDRTSWRQAGESVAARATRTPGRTIAFGATWVGSGVDVSRTGLGAWIG